MNGVVVWLTGPPASGKSTLARRAQAALRARGRPVALLDGDELRAALHPRPGYSVAERDAFYATLADLAALLARQGLIVVVAATAHLRAQRARAREHAPRLIEVHLAVAPEECARRDPKGLYRAARAGEISGLPGADLPYEPPLAAEVTATGGEDERALARLLALVEAGGPCAPPA